jgi:hypothetical protein
MENETDTQESLNPEGLAEPETAEADEPETSATYEDYLKVQKAYESQKVRAEKAEAENKQFKKLVETAKPKEKETPKNTISLKDQYALLEAKVPIDDLEEVLDYASHKGLSVADALKTSVVKAILSERAEERQTAQAANIGPVMRSSSKASDETLLDKFEKGELPEEDIERAVKARIQRMKGA